LGASLLVSQALGLLSKIYPRLKAQIVESPFEALLSWLQSGRIDVIIGTLRTAPFSDEFHQSPLFPDPYCLVVRKDHPLCAVDAISEADLRHFEWILPRAGTPRRIAVEALFKSFDKRPHTIVETSSMGLTRDLLLNGDRVTLLSRDQIIFEDRLGLLSTLDFLLPKSARVIGSISRSDWLPTELQRQFLEILTGLAKPHSQGT
jgi:LysR family transcriptional regulator of gallate degradation